MDRFSAMSIESHNNAQMDLDLPDDFKHKKDLDKLWNFLRENYIHDHQEEIKERKDPSYKPTYKSKDLLIIQLHRKRVPIAAPSALEREMKKKLVVGAPFDGQWIGLFRDYVKANKMRPSSLKMAGFGKYSKLSTRRHITIMKDIITAEINGHKSEIEEELRRLLKEWKQVPHPSRDLYFLPSKDFCLDHMKDILGSLNNLNSNLVLCHQILNSKHRFGGRSKFPGVTVQLTPIVRKTDLKTGQVSTQQKSLQSFVEMFDLEFTTEEDRKSVV